MSESDPVEAALRITQIGALARAQLVSGQRGRVLAVVSDAVYLLSASNELLWLAPDGAPMHRRCLRLSGCVPRPAEGAPLRIGGHCLRIDRGFLIDSATASLWQPPQVNHEKLVEISEVAARVRALVSGLDMSQAKGLGRLIPEIMGSGLDCATAADDLMLKYARPIILRIADACFQRDKSQVARCADDLVGLGAGLTPSGDDFWGGFLFATNALLQAHPGSGVFDVGITVEPYRARTNQISFALLKDLASGHASEPMHAIANGILSGESLQNIRLNIAQLTRVGHSTGWDMLTGLFAGLLMADNRHHQLT